MDTARPGMQLSVIIPAYNEERRLARGVTAVVTHLETADVDFEVIVVDDGSTDGTRREAETLAARWPRVRLVTLPANRGKGAAVREGVRAAQGELVLFA